LENKKNKKRVRRRVYLIDKKFQFKYAGGIFIFILIAFFAFGLIFYQVAFLPLVEKLRNVYPEMALFIVLKSVYKNLAIALFFLLAGIFAFAIMRSHKIVGPLFRLKGHIRSMSGGDFSSRIQLREKDELKMLATELNLLSQNIGLLVEESKSLTFRMQLAMEELRNKIKVNPDKYLPLAETLSRFEAEIEQFREVLKQYKS